MGHKYDALPSARSRDIRRWLAKLPPAVRLKTTLSEHPDCYVNSGLCTLPPTDWKIITDTVSFTELFSNLDALKGTLQAAGGCVEFYLWVIANEVADALENSDPVGWP
jgi:hypothetical protein